MADERDRESATPSEQASRLYEEAESEAAQAAERLVGSHGFASLLGQLAENAAAMTKLGYDAMDLVLRNLRVAGRRDVVRLARQLGRTEDKLERVLQELEQVRDELREQDEQDEQDGQAVAPRRSGAAAQSGASNGAPTGAARARRRGPSGRAGKSGNAQGKEGRSSS
ncbi:MAG TPA: hypothetical protein VG325_02480 [Solirubrobacteraceae bacterium]|nr:hypothetical protein [Solirubrobacteraceae bacterium]